MVVLYVVGHVAAWLYTSSTSTVSADLIPVQTRDVFAIAHYIISHLVIS